MKELSDLERQNYGHQAEMIHLTLGYHEARLREGHPFALGNDVGNINIKEAQYGALKLHAALQGDPRIPLDLDAPSSESSPIERIRTGVLASVWDSFNHVYGLLDPSVHPKYHPFFLDEDASELFETSNRVGELMMEQSPHSVHRYVGAHSVHSGFRVGINTLISLAAIQEGIPEGHSFDAMPVARVIAKMNEIGLSVATNELNAFFPKFPDMVHSFLDDKGRVGIADTKLRSLLEMQDLGCPALRPMGEVSRTILQRHDLFYPELDGPPAIKILGKKIRSYIHDCIADLRMKMDFQDSALLPAFDRRVVDGTILGLPVSRRKKQ